jgi:hypothetical protein
VSFDCASVRELLPEYAAGALDGRDRATIEAHLQSCTECRVEADAFVEVADSVLALAPLGEPPVGFEAAVLQRIGAPARRRVGVRVLAVAAAFVAAVLGLALGRSSAPSDIQTAALRADGSYVGKAWVHKGDPGWIYVDMRYREPVRVNVEVVDAKGTTSQVGQLVLRDGHGTLGARSPVPVDTVRKIRMRESNGTIVCQAVLSA